MAIDTPRLTIKAYIDSFKSGELCVVCYQMCVKSVFVCLYVLYMHSRINLHVCVWDVYEDEVFISLF